MCNDQGWASLGPNYEDSAEPAPHKVVTIGAICDFGIGAPEFGDSQSFRITEYLTLDNGQHVVLTSDRGWSTSAPRELVELEDGRRIVLRGAAPMRSGMTPESVRAPVLLVVQPDEDDTGEDHPWAFLVERARTQGIAVTEEELKALEYKVTLTRRLHDWLTLS